MIAPGRRRSGSAGIGEVPGVPSEIRLPFVADIAAIVVIAIWFVAHFGAMRVRYLGPDEAFHVWIADARDLVDVYLGSKATPHPPLFFLVLHLWMRLGRSEFFLRLLPSIFGAAFLWSVYRWSIRLFGRAAGLVTLLLAAISPALLQLSTEVRGYSLLLFLLAAGLAQFESAVEADSPTRMAVSFLLLFLAILTHYAALFVVLSLAVYAPFRLRKSRSSRRVILVWAAAQVGVALLYLFLYLSQVRTLKGSGQEQETMAGWLGSGYFRGDRESVLSFLARQSAGVFRYLFGSPALAVVAFLAVLMGVVLLAVKRRPSAFLVALPLLFGATAGLLGAYPFVGSRHSLYVLPFVLAAIGVAFSAVAGGRLWVALGASLVLVPFLWMTPAPAGPQSLVQMNDAMEQLRRRAPAESLILTDFQTGTVLRYYFDRHGARNYRLVRSPMWSPDPRTFGDEVERMIRVHRLTAGQMFWVIRIGSEVDASQDVLRKLPNATALSTRSFGDLLILEVRL